MSGLVSRGGSGIGRLCDKDGSRNTPTGGAGDLSSNDRWIGRPGTGREGERWEGERGIGAALIVGCCLGDAFSGLLGGVLNGEMRSSEDACSCRGAREPFSWCDRAAGLAGILGFSARLAGGGSETLLPFRSDGLSRPFATASVLPGDKRPGLFSVAKDAVTGVVGR